MPIFFFSILPVHAHILLSMPWGPSANHLKYAYLKKEKVEENDEPSTKKTKKEFNEKIQEAREKVEKFTRILGVAAVHPQQDVQYWPPPEGMANRPPATNALRQNFLDIDYADEEGFQERYEHLVNRTMLHKCLSLLPWYSSKVWCNMWNLHFQAQLPISTILGDIFIE